MLGQLRQLGHAGKSISLHLPQGKFSTDARAYQSAFIGGQDTDRGDMLHVMWETRVVVRPLVQVSLVIGEPMRMQRAKKGILGPKGILSGPEWAETFGCQPWGDLLGICPKTG